MKNKMFLIITSCLVISTSALAEIDLSKGYRNSRDKSFSSFSDFFNRDEKHLDLSVNYTHYSVDSEKNNDLDAYKNLMSRNAKIKNDADIMMNFSKLGKKDEPFILTANYNRFNSNNLQANTFMGGLAFQLEDNMKAGVVVGYEANTFSKSEFKRTGYMLGGFYGVQSDDFNAKIALFGGKTKDKVNDMEVPYTDNKYYGINLIGKMNLPLLTSEENKISSIVFVDAFGLVSEFQKEVEIKILDKDGKDTGKTKKEIKRFKDKTANATIGLGLSKEVDLNNATLKAEIKAGYNREFFTEEKFLSLTGIEEASKNNVVAGVGLGVEFQNSFELNAHFNTKFAIGNSKNTEFTGGVGFRMKL